MVVSNERVVSLGPSPLAMVISLFWALPKASSIFLHAFQGSRQGAHVLVVHNQLHAIMLCILSLSVYLGT